MKLIGITLVTLAATLASAQNTFSVTGTQIPPELVRLNYGKIPKGIEAFDLNICNQSVDKRAVTASQIFQGLAESSVNLQPLGGQIMLAAILQNQRRNSTTLLTVAVNSAFGVLAVLSLSRTGVSSATLAGAALGAAIGQQLLGTLKPVLTAGQLARYQSQVLESALVLDGGSCVERTVFALAAPGAKNKFQSLTFHAR
jgi:hypothetical protein